MLPSLMLCAVHVVSSAMYLMFWGNGANPAHLRMTAAFLQLGNDVGFQVQSVRTGLHLATGASAQTLDFCTFILDFCFSFLLHFF